MSDLVFEWDEKKNDTNITKHGVDFNDAALIFLGEIIEAVDGRKKYGEIRYIAFGTSRLGVLRVTYTWRGKNIIRIISAWRASRYDSEKYYSETHA